MAGAVYWVGADGNIYLKSAAGVQNLGGQASGIGSTGNYNLGDGGFESNTLQQSVQAQRIADPNAPRAVTAAPTGGAAPKVLNQAAVNNTQATIDQIPGLLQAALEAESRSHDNALHAFDAQEQQQRGAYDTGTTTNQQNYDQTFMDSIRAGIKGLAGLRALLAGSGAAGGTAEDQVNDVVGGITADDIRTGSNTQKNNQTNLDSSLSSFLTDLKGKRQQNEDTFANNQAAVRRDSNTQLQDLYSKMAGFFGDADQTAQRDAFMAKAGAITPSIAADSRRVVSNYDTTPVAVQAPQLTAFAAPSQPDAATVPQDGQVGSGIFTIARKKDQATTPVMVPQGA